MTARAAALIAAVALVLAAPAAAPAGTYAALGGTYLLQGVSAAAFVGTVVLGGLIPKLLRWNSAPHGSSNTEVN